LWLAVFSYKIVGIL